MTAVLTTKLVLLIVNLKKYHLWRAEAFSVNKQLWIHYLQLLDWIIVSRDFQLPRKSTGKWSSDW